MTSHYRHRRDGNAAAPFVNPMEQGEIAVNTANRQIAVGDLGGGQPLALIAVRYFDVKSQYLAKDFAVYNGTLYVATVNISPGPFNPAQWYAASNDPNDTTDLSNYLQKAGGTMTGPIVLAGPPGADLEAATKLYVDSSRPPPPNAANIPVTPVGGISATDLQSAIAELDAEKVNRVGDTMTGHLFLPTSPAAANAVRKDYVDAAVTTVTNLANSKVSKSGDTMVGNLNINSDLYVNRGPNEGVVFLGSNGSHYLYWNGGTYIMPSGGLSLGGNLSAVGGTFGGMLTTNGGYTQPNSSNHTLNNNGVYFASATASSIMIQGPPYPTIAFHCQGYFGANFGMNTDGNFYMGGWSHGEGVAYKFWTTRDFGALPTVPGNIAVGGRLVFAATWNQGPYTGGPNNRPVHSVTYDVTLAAQGDYYVLVSNCYIQLQTQDGGFYTFPQTW